MAHERYDCGPGCPVAATLDLMGGKWKGSILYLLLDGPLRFNVLQRLMGAVAERTLSLALKDLQAAGLVSRTVLDLAPPAVEYALTEEGERLRPILLAMRDFGVRRLVAAGAALPDDRAVKAAAEAARAALKAAE